MSSLTFDIFLSRALHLATSTRSGRPSRGRLVALFHEYLVEASQSTLNETAFCRMLSREFRRIHPSEHQALFRLVSNGNYVVSVDSLVNVVLPADRPEGSCLRRRSQSHDHFTSSSLQHVEVKAAAAAAEEEQEFDPASDEGGLPRSPTAASSSCSKAPAKPLSSSSSSLSSVSPSLASGLLPSLNASFKLRNGDDDVTDSALSVAAERLRQDLVKYTKASCKVIRVLFSEMDNNGNGTVGSYELSSFLRDRAISADFAHRTCQRLVRFFDSTNTSTLNYSDFESMLAPAAHEDHWRVSGMSAALLHRMGAAGSGGSGAVGTSRAQRTSQFNRRRERSLSAAALLQAKRVTALPTTTTTTTTTAVAQTAATTVPQKKTIVRRSRTDGRRSSSSSAGEAVLLPLIAAAAKSSAACAVPRR